MRLILVLFLLILAGPSLCLDNGLMRTPPMGWLAWERFRCNTDCKNDPENCISEKLFKAMADKLVEDGWKKLGYVYVNIDDCWSAKTRDAQGRLQPDPERFPSGIKVLADYVHSKGLKLGIYGDMGKYTCGGYPGTTLDTIEIDAKTFAEWEVDMLKFDGCYSNSSVKAIGYPKMKAALNATGRPIAYSCSWPAYDGGLPPEVNYTLLGEICNLWRNYGDIQDSWDSVMKIIEWYGDNQDVLQPAAGPGKWNDPDMLIIGDFGLSYDQSKAQMALWTILAAPLFMSNDLRSISDKAKYLLQNQLAIYINQNPLGKPGVQIMKSQRFEVWKRTLSNGEYAVAFFHKATDGMPRPFLVNLALLHITDCTEGYKVYDVFDLAFMGDFTALKLMILKINPTGVVLLFFRPLC
ncbi:alpha-N-acetylgalactosaminidase-like [Latimeria chalumnae]|uniref:Alpha-galactosidase n=1 Tax=Latimeria chalumnae TaxID=7897 RepID=H3ACC2_LATCH|nr:PREDICTED: alpha-N-acetylgalactosaminidase-like [Latimeria chalumnae]XP_006011834.1 PREDICTED: alpha-N-acetylgalactosaminidase-like [Latimeria chalumnae]XP_006011835.1 PREDICTED: alpha-N-acetylgalactosaminidase-like [Latimeria chalumnae]XP_006011836.1 PREDICTED: alpha-N-acetylgalactosaminidase-like [Latimeria chalumnae]|eukprot:XP_006011833.1 PREDICTED: alpha-N-acetylgalactosaminidase-like [Latimeria chalumnae]